MSRGIMLTRGKVAVVDDDDYAWLSQWKWCVSGRYAASRIDGELIYMHRLIMGAQPGVGVDHVSGERFDNRRCNLRFATQKENSRNQKRRKQHGYKGVYQRKDTRKWQVKIMVDYRAINLGCYTNEEIAATAYDVAARIFFGEFAKTNFDWPPLRQPNND